MRYGWSLFVLLALLCCGCPNAPHNAKVILKYHDEIANDGSVARNVWTTLEVIDLNCRAKFYGDWGNTGDVFTIYWCKGNGWTLLP
jgi:hypothetical protein